MFGFFLTYSQSVRAKKKQKKKKEKRRKRKEEEKGDIFLFYEIHGVSQANDWHKWNEQDVERDKGYFQTETYEKAADNQLRVVLVGAFSPNTSIGKM